MSTNSIIHAHLFGQWQNYHSRVKCRLLSEARELVCAVERNEINVS